MQTGSWRTKAAVTGKFREADWPGCRAERPRLPLPPKMATAFEPTRGLDWLRSVSHPVIVVIPTRTMTTVADR